MIINLKIMVLFWGKVLLLFFVLLWFFVIIVKLYVIGNEVVFMNLGLVGVFLGIVLVLIGR